MKKTIVLICDYGTGDPAFTEVMLQLHAQSEEIHVSPISTPPFSTLNTGFWICQVALTPNLKNTYIYSNTAPRRESKEAQANNAGEKLMYAKLTTGFEIIAVNSIYNFSFIKPYLQDFFYVKTQNNGSQFRSRDYYPQIVTKMIQEDYSFLGEPASTESIPDYPKSAIASIDGYGNIKTTSRLSEMTYAPGQKLTIELNGETHHATFTDGVFNIPEGNLALAPGSSGHKDKFVELFVRGGSAQVLFNHPQVEQTFTVTP